MPIEAQELFEGDLDARELVRLVLMASATVRGDKLAVSDLFVREVGAEEHIDEVVAALAEAAEYGPATNGRDDDDDGTVLVCECGAVNPGNVGRCDSCERHLGCAVRKRRDELSGSDSGGVSES